MYRYDEYDRTLVDQRVEQFRGQVARRLTGELSEDEFKPLRLMNGLYLQLHAYMVKTASASNWYNAKRINESTYAYKVISDNDGYILGAHIVGPHAEESINLFAMAIKAKMKVGDIRNMVYSYPSMGSDIGSMV